MKKLFPQDWLELQPYNNATSVDRYYTDVANRIYELLVNSGIDTVVEYDDDVRFMALSLSGMFQDVISEVGVWPAFTAECKRRYGAYLPFYALDESEYYADEINVEDVRYWIWHHVQQSVDDGRLINPENPAVMLVAEAVYAIFDEEFEKAPVNERLLEFMTPPAGATKDDYAYLRKVMEWFHFDSWFNVLNELEFVTRLDEFMDEFKKDESATPEYASVMTRTMCQDAVHIGRQSPLSLTTPEWLGRIWASAPNAELFEQMEVRAHRYWEYVGVDEQYVYVRDMNEGAEAEVLNLTKESVSSEILSVLKVNETVLFSSLLRFGAHWWHYGMMVPTTLEDGVEQLKYMKLQKMGNEQTYEAFVKQTEGKSYVFLENKSELEKLLEKMYKTDSDELLSLLMSEVLGDGPLFLSVLPDKALCLVSDSVSALNSKDNAYYDGDGDESRVLALAFHSDLVPYEYACMLMDEGMLKDARIVSALGEEHGHIFMQENLQFFMDYFRHCYREADYKGV